MSSGEREVTHPVELCWSDRVNPAAIGWSRRPLHRCELTGPWGRRKRWHHWCVTSANEVIAMTLADLDFVGLATVGVIDRHTSKITREMALRPLGLGLELPTRADRGGVEFEQGGTRVCFTDNGAQVRLVAKTKSLAIDVTAQRPEEHETLGVAVRFPGSDGRQFAYSSKQLALPASGVVTVEGAHRELPPGTLATLDWGRGVWPHRTSWNWASAAGAVDGEMVAINLGAQWTTDGGATENALLVDGKLTKLEGDVRFEWSPKAPREPWRLRGPQVDLVVTPQIVEDVKAPGVGRLCLVTGWFDGTVAGREVRKLFGGAEELAVRW